MNATKRLRAMLDERGVRWKRVRGHKDNGTSWHDVYGSYVEAVQEYAWDGGEFPEGEVIVRRGPAYMTPEQAIAATMGHGECKLPETRVDHGSIEYSGVTEWRRCSACGTEVLAYPVHFCPNCGRRVVKE